MIVSHASTTKMRTLPTHLTLTTLKCHFRVGYLIFTISYAHNALYTNYAFYTNYASYASYATNATNANYASYASYAYYANYTNYANYASYATNANNASYANYADFTHTTLTTHTTHLTLTTLTTLTTLIFTQNQKSPGHHNYYTTQFYSNLCHKNLEEGHISLFCHSQVSL